MDFPRVKPRANSEKTDPGVYIELDHLIRLKYQARGYSFLPRQPVHSILSGRHASRLRGRGLNFEELRGYLPGDDIRNIDWKVTARTTKPHVRVYTEEKDRPALLLIDQRMSMFFGSQQVMKSVTCAEAAALSAWRILESGDRVGAIIFNDHEMAEIRPHRSESRVMEILKQVVTFNQQLNAQTESDLSDTSPTETDSFREASSPEMLNKALLAAQRLAKHDFLVILITDCFGADEVSSSIITKLCQHNDMITALVYDPLEAKLPNVGKAVVSQAGQQLEVDTSNSRLQDKFNQQFAQRLEQAKKFSRTREIPLIPVHTGEDVAVQIRRLLGESSFSSGRGPRR